MPNPQTGLHTLSSHGIIERERSKSETRTLHLKSSEIKAAEIHFNKDRVLVQSMSDKF